MTTSTPQKNGADFLTTPKNPVLACVLSIVACGAGQLYNEELGKAAALFFGAVIAGLLFGAGAVILVIPLIIFAAQDAYKVAISKNALADADMARKAEAESVQATFLAETTSSNDLVAQIEKLHRLQKSGLLDSDEFAERKQQALMQLAHKRPREAAEDFLTAVIPLVQTGALTDSEIRVIKSHIF